MTTHTDTTPTVALLCHRCGQPFKTPQIRTICPPCAAAGAQHIPEGAVG